MSNFPPDLNPYASPAAADGLVPQPIVSSYQLLKDVKQFRSEIHALGGLWIVAGIIPLVIAVISAIDALESGFPLEQVIVAGFFAALGLSFLLCGIFTCCKQMWAVYVGLILSYLMAVLSLLGCNIWVAMAYTSGIFGGHRIITWANELRRKGVPITTRPRDIQTPIKLPPMFPSATTVLPTMESPKETLE